MKSKNQRRRQKKKEAKAERTSPSHQELPNPPQLSEKEPTSKLSVLARKYDWINENDPLYDMYRKVSSRLKRKRDDDALLETHKRSYPDQSDAASSYKSTHKSTGNGPEVPGAPASKKQLRRVSKPSLAKLKSLTEFPELIEWYDADAKHPEFLVQMKSAPGVVQVPPNWRLRQEIPQFGPKPPYELPEPVRATRISEIRRNQTNATNQQRDSHGVDTLKTHASAGDVDYDLLHSAFFGPNATYEYHLLPFGQVIDLKLRQRAFKPSSPDGNSQHKNSNATTPRGPPGSMSSRLRAALDLKPGESAPWQSYVTEHGLAPGFTTQNKPIQLWGELK